MCTFFSQLNSAGRRTQPLSPSATNLQCWRWKILCRLIYTLPLQNIFIHICVTFCPRFPSISTGKTSGRNVFRSRAWNYPPVRAWGCRRLEWIESAPLFLTLREKHCCMGIILPNTSWCLIWGIGYYFGVSAATGDLSGWLLKIFVPFLSNGALKSAGFIHCVWLFFSDNHDIISLKFYNLDEHPDHVGLFFWCFFS